MKNLQDFINLWLNKTCKVLPNNLGGQCFDLAVGWTDNLGVPHYPNNPSPFPYVKASQIYTGFTSWQAQYFDRIPNTPTGVPPEGALVVWGDSYGGVGHVAIKTDIGDTNTFQAFSQNDPIGSKCVLKTYNYNHVLGWLVCKLPPPGTGTPPTDDCPAKLAEKTALETELRGAITRKDDEIKHLNETMANLNSTIESKNRQIADLEAGKEQLAKTLSECQYQLESKTEQANKLPQCEILVKEQEVRLQSLKEEIATMGRQVNGWKTKWDLIKLPYSKLLKKLLIDRLL